MDEDEVDAGTSRPDGDDKDVCTLYIGIDNINYVQQHLISSSLYGLICEALLLYF